MYRGQAYFIRVFYDDVLRICRVQDALFQNA
jgi:hypothetical protein